MALANLKSYYNHDDYVKCMDMAQFAQHFAFKDKTGKVLGKNLIYALMRKMGILKGEPNKNEPYQSYVTDGLLRSICKTYYQGDKLIPKNIVFITPKGVEYFPDKINRYIEECTQGRLTLESIEAMGVKPVNAVSAVSSVVEYAKPTERVEMTREHAVDILAGLPEKLRNSIMAQELRRKFDIDG